MATDNATSTPTTPQQPVTARERGEKWVVGIDLGTTNSAISRVPLDEEHLEDVTILQRVSENQTASNRVLPSFLYLPGPYELPEGSLALPWDEKRAYIVGEYARVQGSRVPGRVVSSAKSWLAHRRADPHQAILPWESLKESAKVSAVEASRRYLQHMRESWDYEHPEAPLALQSIVLTVPASFDEVARELTLLAADQAGLERVSLLEEPQAAFYAWLWERSNKWRKELRGVNEILVCDIGGGTTDFTVIRVGEEALERIAVGDHLMLGGDNLDIAIAHLVEPRLQGELDLLQWGVLRHECRRAKELLLSEQYPESCTITVPGSGTRLMAAAKTAEITHEEVSHLVLDGFFPFTEKDAPLQEKNRTGLREWGLPYASDPAIPRHLAAFLRRHNLNPDAVLFNGGACRPAAIRKRITEILAHWTGHDIRILENSAADLSVARGAAAFAWLKRHGRERIKGGIARSYYIGVGEKQALCVIHRNQDEGERQPLENTELRLSVGRPVAFPLFAASDRPQDQAGQLVDTEQLNYLGSLETVVAGLKNERQEIPVHLAAQVTEIGTMALWATSLNNSRQWALQLPLRGKRRTATAPALPPNKLPEAQALINATFALKPNNITEDTRPRNLISKLEAQLGPRDAWPPVLTRALWETFLACAPRRRCDPEFEAAWLNGAGFLLRPGVGYPLDKWRVEQMSALLTDWLQYPKDERVRKEWWVFWRRLSAGMGPAAQTILWSQMAPRLIPGRRHIKSRVKSLVPSETTEFMRCAASLEQIPMSEKLLLGQLLADHFKPRPENCWLIARIGARVLLGGGPQDVLPPEIVEPWAQRFLDTKWGDAKAAGLALADIARFTGDKVLDLSESLRQNIAQRLTSEGLPDSATAVLELVELDQDDRARLSGDTLPIGLRL